jgi:hypothetical protein
VLSRNIVARACLLAPFALLPLLGACGKPAESAGSSGSSAPADAGSKSPPSSADAGAATSADAGGGGGTRPFAKNPTEATELITAAVDQKASEIKDCVKEYRFRNHLAHDKVAVEFGVDQEGRLIGVKLKTGKDDKELSNCVHEVLKDAAFPRSHSGVISIQRSYQEVVK